jgi:hypothetical protein
MSNFQVDARDFAEARGACVVSTTGDALALLELNRKAVTR